MKMFKVGKELFLEKQDIVTFHNFSTMLICTTVDKKF